MSVSEKKQDLLLDALSCIDEDILARGLALRDGAAATNQKSTAQPEAHLFNLSELDRKPPRRHPWRVILVAAAIITLMAVIPLSVWMVARRSTSNAPVPNAPTGENAGGNGGQNDGNNLTGVQTENEPSLNEPGWESDKVLTDDMMPTDSMDAETALDLVPEVVETEELIMPYTPTEPVWEVVSNQNSYVEKHTVSDMSGHYTNRMNYSYTALVDTFIGSAAEREAFLEETVSSEDELVLDLFARYYLSVYGFDYGSHFLLFHPNYVDARFTAEVQPHTYAEALGRINTVMAHLRPYDTLALDISLTENTLLTGDELSGYLEDRQSTLTQGGLDPARITAVRRFTADGLICIDGRFYTDDWAYGNQFYCYEYDGVWYMDAAHMDDDMCIDYALSAVIVGLDYLSTDHHTGVVTAMDDQYLYLDDGTAFALSSMDLIGMMGIAVGDTVELGIYEQFILPLYTDWADLTAENRVEIGTAWSVRVVEMD